MLRHSKSLQPPRWIEKVLKRFLKEELLESVVGDIHEKFESRVKAGQIK